MGRRGLRSVFALGLLAACSAPSVVRVDLTNRRDAVGFVLQLEEDGRWGVTSGPFALLEDGRLAPDTQSLVPIPERAEQAVVLIPRESLEAAIPGFDASWTAEVELVREAAGRVELLPDRRLRTVVELPADMTLWTVRADRSPSVQRQKAGDPTWDSVRSTLSLRAPFDPEHCRPGEETAMSPWSPVEPITGLSELGFDQNFQDVAIVTPDRLLVASFQALYLLDRGRSVDPSSFDGPAPKILRARDIVVPQDRISLSGVALDPRDRRTAVVLLSHWIAHPSFVVATSVAKIAISEEGLTDVRTSTTIQFEDLTEIAVDAEGRWLAAGRDGVTVFGHVDHEAITRGPVAGTEDNFARAVASTGDAERPWIMSATNRVFEFRVETDTWNETRLNEFVGDNLEFEGLVMTDSSVGREIWTGGTGGRLFAAPVGREWTEVKLEFPPRLSECADEFETARPLFFLSIEGLVSVGDFLFYGSDDCSALVQVRLTDRCTSILTIGRDKAERVKDVVTAIDQFEDQVIVVGNGTGIWEARATGGLGDP